MEEDGDPFSRDVKIMEGKFKEIIVRYTSVYSAHTFLQTEDIRIYIIKSF